MKFLQIFLMALLLGSCGKPDQKNLEEKTQRELMVANENTDKKAMALEADLSNRQLFFTALEGTYEGIMITGDKEFKTRITLIPSLPPYTSNRIRTIEEVTEDLNNLFFSAQTTHWNSKGNAVAAGCIFSQVRPDFQNGTVSIAAENCPNIYKVSMYRGDNENAEDENTKVSERAKNVSHQVFNGVVQKIQEIYVVVQPTLIAKTFTVKLKRVQP